MARKYNIRWSDKDDKELKRLVKNFNAKVSRLEKKEPYLKDVRPEKISYKDIKEDTKTRQDFNRQLNKIKRFQKRGSEKIKTTPTGLATTEYQFKEASIMQRIVTRKRREKRKTVESWQRQESESLFDKPKVTEVEPSGFKKYVESLEREVLSNYDLEKQIIYRENYIEALYDTFGSLATGLVYYISALPLDSFVKHALSNPMLAIDFIYTEEEVQEVLEQMTEEWQRVV